MQGHRNAEPICLADEGAADLVDLGRPPRLDVLEHRRVVTAAPLGRVDVHLPGILVQLDFGRRRDALALLDELVDEVTEVLLPLPGGEVRVVREPGERSDRVDGRVEDQLRPLARQEVAERTGLQLGANQLVGHLLDERERRLAVGPEPGLRVEDVLDLGVGMARAAHESDGRDQRPGSTGCERRLGAEPVLHGHHRCTRPVAGQAVGHRLELGRLGRDDG